MSDVPDPASLTRPRPEAFRTPYEGYDVLEKWDSPSWNEQTRAVVRARLTEVPARNFFTEQEWATLVAACDRILPQPDRPGRPVPIAPWIDDALHRGQGDGYRYADLPPDRETWRLGLRGIGEDALNRFDRRFANLTWAEQDAVLQAVQDGAVRGESWRRLPPKRFFNILLERLAGVYYSHPAAWSEIGYGGPASPRGYVRLGFDQRDPWEARRA